MKTKFDVGDIVLVPMKVCEVIISESGTDYYLIGNSKVKSERFPENGIIKKANTKEMAQVHKD